MNITTNKVPRPVLYWHELTDKERQEFDYLKTETAQEDGRFFRYKGAVYDLGEFVRIVERRAESTNYGFSHPVDSDSPLLAWHGIQTDSFYSAIVVHYVDNAEYVIVGRATT